MAKRTTSVRRQDRGEVVGKKKIGRRFLNVVEIAIPPRGLDPQTSRSIVDFHRSRNIQVRFGKSLKNICRWCFSDAATAEAFKEEFGGNYVTKSDKTIVKRTMPNIIAARLFRILLLILYCQVVNWARRSA